MVELKSGDVGMKFGKGPFDYGEADIGYSSDYPAAPDMLLEIANLTRDVEVLRSQVVGLRKSNHELRQFIVAKLPNLAQKGAGQSTKVVAPPVNKPVEAPSDKREVGRRRTRLENGIILSTNFKVIGECSIYDKSEGGYQLKVRDGKSVPMEFYLLQLSDGLLSLGNVRWNRGGQLGYMVLKSLPRHDFEYPEKEINAALTAARLGRVARAV